MSTFIHKLLTMPISPIDKIIAGNMDWIKNVKALTPSFFTHLKEKHEPEILYIGCSDARLPVTLMTGQAPGKIFISRNVGNVAQKSDKSVMAVIEYAIKALKIRHIVICGHQSCGGVTAAYRGGISDQLPEVDSWITPIKETYFRHKAELDAISDETTRIDALSELNIKAQMKSVSELPLLQQYPWVQIHGLFASLDGVPFKHVGTIGVQLPSKL